MAAHPSLAVLVAVALVLTACGADGDDGGAAAGTTTTTTMPPTTTTAPPPAGDEVDDTAPDVTVEGADDAVRDWFQALGTGATDDAWALLHPRSQAVLGSREAFARDASALAEGYGAWAGSPDASYGIVPLTSDEPGLSVVVVQGTVAQEGPPAPSVAAVPVRTSADGVSLVDPFHDLLGPTGLEVQPAPGTEVPPDPTFEAVVPAGLDVRFVVDDRGAFEPASEVVDGDRQRVTGAPDQPLEPGRHGFTVVALRGGDVQARAVLYGVDG